jgi:hypothetical protein
VSIFVQQAPYNGPYTREHSISQIDEYITVTEAPNTSLIDNPKKSQEYGASPNCDGVSDLTTAKKESHGSVFLSASIIESRDGWLAKYFLVLSRLVC